MLNSKDDVDKGTVLRVKSEGRREKCEVRREKCEV
jgi:hypothetical protein